ncbi:aquaporin-like protein, partial [Aulographum hederae CBS 113979]
MGEATGVFFYVFCGLASLASFTINQESPLGTPFFGNLLQVGLAFAVGIAFAIITCASVSGGHFNPAITICLALWQGFPWKKVPHYIFSQIFGGFMAALMITGMWWPEISALRAQNMAEHGTAVFNGGAASILVTIPNPNQTNQGFLFFQEFFVDSLIGIVVWTCLDPANPFLQPVAVPWTIGLAYGVMAWGFGANSISTNLARDIGPRIVATIFFGREAFAVDNGYAWISILVNIPATIFATGYYEFLMRDSIVNISKGHAEHEEGDEGLVRHLSYAGTLPLEDMEDAEKVGQEHQEGIGRRLTWAR